MGDYAKGKDNAVLDVPGVGQFEGPYSKDNAQYIKLFVAGVNHSITGIKADIEFLKFTGTAAAFGLTLLKADISVVKVDEKGITVLGKTVKSFEWNSLGIVTRRGEAIKRWVEDRDLRNKDKLDAKAKERAEKEEKRQQKLLANESEKQRKRREEREARAKAAKDLATTTKQDSDRKYFLKVTADQLGKTLEDQIKDVRQRADKGVGELEKNLGKRIKDVGQTADKAFDMAKKLRGEADRTKGKVGHSEKQNSKGSSVPVKDVNDAAAAISRLESRLNGVVKALAG